MEENKKSLLREKLEAELPHFTGSEEWHRQGYPWLRRQFLITDGVKYLADTAKSYWLMDVIASHFANRRVMAESFQVWKLVVNSPDATPAPFAEITADDGNGKLLAKQAIPYTDFPLSEISLYVTNDDDNGIVVMLPSEY